MGSLTEFRRLIACFEAGRIAPHIDTVLPLERATDALARAAEPARLGKVVLKIAPWPGEETK